MKKRICICLFMIISWTQIALAQQFEVESVKYEVSSESKKTVRVISGGGYVGKVVIPDKVTNNDITYDVTEIGGWAFHDCKNMTSITIPQSVTKIGDYAFYLSSGLTSIALPEAIESIGEHAFYANYSLKSISLGNQIKSIGNNAFGECNELSQLYINDIGAFCGINFANTESNPLSRAQHLFVNGVEISELNIPEGVVKITDNLFQNLTNITSLSISSSVKFIGDNAFSGCTNLASIEISESSTGIDFGQDVFANTKWFDNNNDGVVYLGSVLYKYKGSMLEETNLSIAEGTTSIAGGAFKDFSNLNGISIPESVTHIGKDAFTGTTWYNNLPDGEVYINNVLYRYKGEMPINTSLSIQDGTINISEGAFENYQELTNVTLPHSLKSVGKRAFADCYELTYLTFDSELSYVGEDAFLNCSKINSLHISAIEQIFDGIYYADKDANPATWAGHLYINGAEVSELIIPEGITEINNGFFYKFGNNVSSVVIPNSVTRIDNNAFSSWPKLNSVTLGESVQSIGEYAFAWCPNLEYISLSNSLKSIERWAFEGCDKLQIVNINSIETLFGISYGDDWWSNPFNRASKLHLNGEELTELLIPESFTEVNQGFFPDNLRGQITSVVIPNSVTKIGDNAFSSWSNLTSIVIPNSVDSIGKYAFAWCSELNHITLGNNLKFIGVAAFEGCDKLQTVNFNSIETLFGISYGDWGANPFNRASKLYVNGEELTKLVIPESVIEVKQGFFPDNVRGQITSVVIPNSVTKIGDNAFNSWSNLTSVTLGESVKTIGEYAFGSCDNLQSIVIPNSVDSIGHGAFQNCGALTSIEIPNSVKNIASRTFYDCDKLTSVTLGESIKTIGDNAFESCDNLQSIVIPNSVDSLGQYAFAWCSELNYITLGNSMKFIGGAAFDGCNKLQTVNFNSIETLFGMSYGDWYANPFSRASRLHVNGELITEIVIPESFTEVNQGFFPDNVRGQITSVVIPNSVTKIGNNAFSSWNNLKNINLGDSIESFGYDAFSDCNSLASVNVSTLDILFKDYFFENGNSSPFNKASQICVNNEPITELVIPESVKVIKTGVFNGSNITSLNISNSVEKIGDYAFSDCANLTTVTMGDAVTFIGENAFSGCNNLQRVDVNNLDAWYNIDFENIWANPLTIAKHLYHNGEEVNGLVIPDGILEINEGFFSGFENITSITLPNSVVKIGSRAFRGLSNLQSVTLGESVKTIGEYAFESCNNLQSIVIPNSVDTIGAWAFWNCSELNYITLGNNLKYIGGAAFEGCDKLQTVNLNSIETLFGMSYGDWSANPFSRASKLHVNGELITEIVIPESFTEVKQGFFPDNVRGQITSVVIPNSITKIGDYAFSSWSNLTSIVIPNSVDSIGKYAFGWCYELAYISIGDKVKFFDEGAFESCGKLQTVNVNSIETLFSISYGGDIGHTSPFSRTSKLHVNGEELTELIIPESFTEVNQGFFPYDNLRGQITSVVIPNSVTKIGNSAFNGWSNLTSITLGESVKTIGDNAFESCNQLQSIVIPNSVDTIGAWAFQNCDKLTSVTLGESVKAIGENTFHSCDQLQSIVIPNSVDTIGAWAFSYCYELNYITLGNNLKYIGFAAFEGCDKLQTVNLNSIETLFNLSYDANTWSANPFNRASKLYVNGEELTELVIPESLTEVNQGFFPDNVRGQITSVVIPNSVTKIGDNAFNGWSNLTSIVIPNSVDSIGKDAFANCGALTSIEIPNSVKNIAIRTFYNCDNLASVTLGESVKTIGGYAFGSCDNLQSIVIPNSVDSIGHGAFQNCNNLTSVTLGESVKTIGDNAFESCNQLQSIVIPNSVDTIGPWAFSYCYELNHITLGNNLKYIGFAAFEGCDKLQTVNLNSIETLFGMSYGDWSANPFNRASKLHVNGELITEIVIPESFTEVNQGFFPYDNLRGQITSVVIPNSVTKIGNSAFNGWSNLTSITLGESVKTIGDNAFESCNQLQSIVIPNSVDTIGAWAFLNCSELNYITLGNNLKYIGGYAFQNCDKLTSVTLGESIKTIGDNAFESCDNLQSIVIPNSVDSLGQYAFAWCSELNYITLGNSMKFIGGAAFEGCDKLQTINAPSLEALLNIDYGEISWDHPFNRAKNLTINNEPLPTELVIPNTVKKIPNAIFRGRNIVSVIVPNSVEHIGRYAFQSCSELFSVTLGDSIKSIGEGAFSDCWNSLKEVHISDIGNFCQIDFENNESNPLNFARHLYIDGEELSEVIIPEGVSKISKFAFREGEGITSVSIPNTVSTIGEYAFFNCWNLKTITLGDGIQTIGEYAFESNWSIERTYIPDEAWLYHVSIDSKGNECLFNNHDLYVGKVPMTSLEVPDNIVDCPILPLLYNSSITSLTTGNGLTKLPKGSSEKITHLVLGKNIKTIQSEFPNALAVISHMETPPSITKKTFPQCMWENGADGIVVVLTPEIEAAYAKAKIWDDIQLSNQSNRVNIMVDTPGDLGYELITKHNMPPVKVVGLTISGEINEEDFMQMKSNMKALLYLDLSNAKVERIPSNALENKQQLQSLKLSRTTKVISNNAFTNCHGIKELELPNDVVEIGHEAFAGTSIESIDFNYALQSIGDRAFANAPLKRISFQSKVKTIGYEAFSGCNLEQELIFPETLTHIGDRAFEGQDGIIGHLTIPESVTSVGYGAFRGASISSVFISGTMTTLAAEVFADCAKLDVVYIPDNITSIDHAAFRGCTSLKELRLPQNVTAIGSEAFRAVDIRSASIPETVDALQAYTFADCANLRFATLPSGIIRLEEGAFYNCHQLMNLTVKAVTPPAVTATTFRGVNTDRCIVSIPTTSYREYVTAEYWGRFIQMRNDIAVRTKGKGSISFASGETSTDEPARPTPGTRAASNTEVRDIEDSDNPVTEVEDGSSLYVPQNGLVRFYITPGEGEEIISATFNEEDITSLIVDNVFETTADRKNGQLEVIFSDLSKKSQQVAWEKDFELVMVGEKIALEASASSGLTVTYTFADIQSGELATISNNILTVVKPGTIAIIAQQQGDDEYAYAAADVKYIQAYEYGDANGNRVINSADLAATIDYALGNTDQAFLFKAADVNKDKHVNVADVAGVVDIVLTVPTDSAYFMSKSVDMMGNVLSADLSGKGLSISLDNEMDDMLTFQCDVRLSDNCMPVLDAAGHPIVRVLGENGTQTQIAVARILNNGNIRILVYSNDNSPISAKHVLLPLEFVSLDVNIDIPSAGYSCRDNGEINYHAFDNKVIKGLENVDDVIAQMEISTSETGISIYSPIDYQLYIYSVDGLVYLLNIEAGYNQFNMKHGVYIIGKNKVIVE